MAFPRGGGFFCLRPTSLERQRNSPGGAGMEGAGPGGSVPGAGGTGAGAGGGGGGGGGEGTAWTPGAPGKRVYTVGSTPFEVDAHYEPMKRVGKGAYGVVCAARDLRSGEEGGVRCAIKKIKRAFDNIMDARRTLREIRILRHFGSHENIIELLDVMRPPSVPFEDVYLVYELMDTDLHQIIRSPQPLTDHHSQYFVYQILRGLKYIHSANILHRDLKPENLLLNASCDLKICDFGLARALAEGREEQEMMTEYVVTRWYRAPELLLSNETYGWEIDMWSVGCILAELLQRRPLFAAPNLQDSMAHLDQLKLIVKTLGSPSDEELEFVESRRARDFLKSLALAPRMSFAEMFPEASPEAVDLCDRMLQFDPRKRITVEEALEHPFIAPLHKINSAPAAERPFSSDFEGIKLDRHELMDLVFQEILKIHPSPPGEAC